MEMSELNNELRAAAQAIAQFSQDFSQNGRVSAKTQDEFAAGSKEQADKLKYAGALAARALGDFTRGMSQFASTLAQGQQGMGAFDGALDGVSSAADSLASSFMVLGGPIGVAAAVLAKIISGAAKVSKAISANADKEYKAYSDLAKTGATARDGMRGTTETARKLGLDVSRLGDFVSLVQKGGKDLALFAGGAAQGRKLLGDLGESLKDERQNFLRLGISVNDANAAMVGMLATQTAMGRSFGGNLDDVSNSVKEYIYEMDVLQRVSGKTREAIESARQDALKEERFAAAVYKAEQEEAGGGKLLTDLSDRIESLGFSPAIAKGVRDLVTEMPGTEEAQALLTTNNTELLKLVPLYKQRKISLDEFQQRLIDNLAEFRHKQGISLGLLGGAGKAIVSGSDQARAVALAQNRTIETQKAARKQQADAKKGADPLADLAAQLETKQREAKAKVDHLGDMLIGPLASAMGKMLNVVDDLVDGIKGLAGWFLGKEPEQRRATDETVAAAIKHLADVEREFAAAQAKSQQTQRAEDKTLADALAEQVALAKTSLASEKELLAQGTAEDRRARRKAQREQGATGPETPGTKTAPAAAAVGTESAGVGGAKPEPTKTGAAASGASDQAAKLISRFEGFSPRAHWDYKQYSIGYGTRTDDVDEQQGKKTIDKAEGLSRLSAFVNKIVPAVVAAGREKQWGQNQIDAMTSFAYNLGSGALISVTGGGKRTNQETADAMLRYDKAGGKSLPGLANRRQAERALFLSDMPQLADGGITNQPSIAGEAGAEAVIPLMNGRVPIELGSTARDLASAIDPGTESRSKNPNTVETQVDLDSVVAGAVATVMTANPAEQEILDMLSRIRRANRDTANNNQKILRAHTN